MKKIIVLSIVLFAFPVFAQNWNPSLDLNNSPLNPDNSSLNPRNSPLNPDNSFIGFGNRSIRDNQGRDTGLYAVPKKDGGINIFNRNGNREGYIPGN